MSARSEFTSQLDLQRQRRGDVRIVLAVGRVDFTTASAFQDALFAEADATAGRGGVVVDLGGLDLITSAGLRVLMLTKKRLSDAGAGLVISGVAGTVADVVRVSRFDTLLTIMPSVEEAVRLLAPDADPAGHG